ncbi:hypothetical protein, conserved [Leishmania donovani]|uniref:DNA repair protein n=1 Tax=Leishmania donovani TaxID=5661 RepID=E9BFL5_LEIDO|nr:hypothetical protein, conserved [Leishmania donovani]CBZ34041.1 hypothetical protein, conserved [Leishmania donovani]
MHARLALPFLLPPPPSPHSSRPPFLSASNLGLCGTCDVLFSQGHCSLACTPARGTETPGQLSRVLRMRVTCATASSAPSLPLFFLFSLDCSATVLRDSLRLVPQRRLMSKHMISVGSRWVHHEVTQALRQRRGVRVEVNEELQHCDFASGASSVLYCDAHSAEIQRDQASLVLRLQEARQRCGTQPVILMVRMDSGVEVSLERLSWLNLECGVAQQCGLILVWSLDDAVQYLASLAASSVTSLEFTGAARPHVGDAPLAVLVDALTQTPQVVTRNDVVRIANRKTSIADALMSEASEWEGIAGLGSKKAARLQHLFRTPFLSSQQRIDSFVPASGESSFSTASKAADSHLPQPTGESIVRLTEALSVDTTVATEGRRRMMSALQRRLDKEDEEGGE